VDITHSEELLEDEEYDYDNQERDFDETALAEDLDSIFGVFEDEDEDEDEKARRVNKDDVADHKSEESAPYEADQFSSLTSSPSPSPDSSLSSLSAKGMPKGITETERGITTEDEGDDNDNDDNDRVDDMYFNADEPHRSLSKRSEISGETVTLSSAAVVKDGFDEYSYSAELESDYPNAASEAIKGRRVDEEEEEEDIDLVVDFSSWKSVEDPDSGATYYINQQTGESQPLLLLWTLSDSI
jgi:hypothetical protein